MRRVIFTAAIGFLFACGGGDKPPADKCIDAPTYTNEIRPLIIEAKCLGCHDSSLKGVDRNNAPDHLNFETYELMQPNLTEAAAAITAGREPPPTLMPPIMVTAEERDLVRDWRDCGFPK